MQKIKKLRNDLFQDSKPLRVAAYCRVSSDSKDQLHSYNAQIQFYTEYIGQHPDWELTDIYADEGLTGTKTERRDELKRLIEDSRRGKIDRVIVKSVSRFARNIYDSLSIARLLKSYGTGVYFEEQNIDTLKMNDELMLTMQSMSAQSESMTISQNMRWSCKRRMENGTYLSTNPPYGFRLINGEYVIIPEESEIVKYIFTCFISGEGINNIAKSLSDMKIPKKQGFIQWHPNTIKCILNNTRYMGDAMFQKSYASDDFPFKTVRNKGQKPMYYAEGTNPSIISSEIFYMAQDLQKAKKSFSSGKGQPRLLTQKVLCSCGHYFRYQKTKNVSNWVCRNHNFNADSCRIPAIPEHTLFDSFTLLVNKLVDNRESILSPMIKQLEQMQSRNSITQRKIYEIDSQIARLNEQNHIIAKHQSKGFINATEFAEQSGVISQKVSALRIQRKKLISENEDDEIIDNLKNLSFILSDISSIITDFDEALFSQIVTHITAISKTEICFHLIGGLALIETIPHIERRTKY